MKLTLYSPTGGLHTRSGKSFGRGRRHPRPLPRFRPGFLAPVASPVARPTAQVAEEVVLPARRGRARLAVVVVVPKQRLGPCEVGTSDVGSVVLKKYRSWAVGPVEGHS